MFYNCHIHTFKESDVPLKFLPLGLVRILATTTGFNVIFRVLNYRNPFSDQIEIREILNMTVLLDHDVIDGAPLARFISKLSYNIEKGIGL
jgi:hypothetical protein